MTRPTPLKLLSSKVVSVPGLAATSVTFATPKLGPNSPDVSTAVHSTTAVPHKQSLFAMKLKYLQHNQHPRTS